MVFFILSFFIVAFFHCRFCSFLLFNVFLLWLSVQLKTNIWRCLMTETTSSKCSSRSGAAVASLLGNRVVLLREEEREPPEDQQEAEDLNAHPPHGQLSSFQHLFLWFLPFAKKCICKASLYIEKHLLFSTLVESKNKNNRFVSVSGRGLLHCLWGFVTFLVVSAFLVKHSVSQQNLPFQAQHWELQSISHRELVSNCIYSFQNLLKILLGWRVQRHYCFRKPGGRRAFGSCPRSAPVRGGGGGEGKLKMIFFLGE